MERTQQIELFGLAAVVVSLLFVAYEVNQSNRIARGTTSYELARNWMEVNQFIISEPGLVELRVKWRDADYVPESEVEREKSLAYARMLLNLWTTVEEAHENGLASDGYMQTARDDVQTLIKNRPGLLPVFDALLENYDMSEYEVLLPLRKTAR